MIREYEGIVIRQTKIPNGRRMVSIFTREGGKISAGTHISERSKSASALAIRPFSYGHFTISEKRKDQMSITTAETIQSNFGIGEDADRFAEASFVLELTDKLLPENAPAPNLFNLLRDYLAILCARKTDFRLPTISYMIKVLQELGVFPDADLLRSDELLSGLNDDILKLIVFIGEQPLKRMDTLTLEASKERVVFGVIKAFVQKHLDVGALKSERMLT